MKKLFLGFLLLPALAAFGACDTEHDADRAAEAEAAVDGGFRLAGTCGPSYDDNSCGGRSGGSGSCWCDSMCSTYGDCCGDYEAFCDGDDPIPPASNLQGEGETCLGIATLECEPGLVCGDVQVGVSDPAGVCMRPCGTIAGLQFDAGEYCDYDTCPEKVADAGGVCRPLGSPICTEQYEPVCGCDGMTYSNECFAAAAGATIAQAGECPVTDECGSDEDCDDGFCGWGEDQIVRVCKPWGELGDSCGGFVLPSARNFCGPGLVCDQSSNGDPTGDVPGVCAVAPVECEPTGCSGQICAPVGAGIITTCEYLPEYACLELAGCGNFGPDGACGWNVDEPAYQECMDGLAVDHADEGEFCGGIAANLPQNQCNEGLTCVGATGACAPGTADMGGTCIDVDPAAICPAIYAPVCGCDGQTYSNACAANVQHGVGILADGPCAPAADSCVDHCGGQSEDGSCWCDAACSYYGDCCSDRVSACG